MLHKFLNSKFSKYFHPIYEWEKFRMASLNGQNLEGCQIVAHRKKLGRNMSIMSDKSNFLCKFLRFILDFLFCGYFRTQFDRQNGPSKAHIISGQKSLQFHFWLEVPS